MHPNFLSLLQCPDTGEPLILEPAQVQRDGKIAEGQLVSASGSRYPIVRGIPRFVGQEHHASSFGYQWSRWPRVQFEAENVGKPMAGHTTRMWEIITEVAEDQVRGKAIAFL